jgi:hypothetical protein
VRAGGHFCFLECASSMALLDPRTNSGSSRTTTRKRWGKHRAKRQRFVSGCEGPRHRGIVCVASHEHVHLMAVSVTIVASLAETRTCVAAHAAPRRVADGARLAATATGDGPDYQSVVSAAIACAHHHSASRTLLFSLQQHCLIPPWHAGNV